MKVILIINTDSSSMDSFSFLKLVFSVSLLVLALIGIKSSLIDPHGVLMNWDDTAVDPCSWNMISCSADGFVLSL